VVFREPAAEIEFVFLFFFFGDAQRSGVRMKEAGRGGIWD
jgi:hypothetical protein